MAKNVLIVDEDEPFVGALQQGLSEYADWFAVTTATRPDQALDLLGKEVFFVLVLSAEMAYDQTGLMKNVAWNHPEVPVILMAEEDFPGLEELAKVGGVMGVLEKPFEVMDLARKIASAIKKLSDAGSLKGVSPGMFLQMIEMEGRSCTIRMTDQNLGTTGVLFFKDGELMDARVKDRSGEMAAYIMFSWDEVSLAIQSDCPITEKRVTSSAQALLLEAMRRKDEGAAEWNDEEPAAPAVSMGDLGGKADDSLGDLEDLGEDETEAAGAVEEPDEEELVFSFTPDSVAQTLKEQIGDRCGLQEIGEDASVEFFAGVVEKAAQLFDGGRLKAAYLERDKGPDRLLLRGKTTFVSAAIKPRCPVTRILQALVF
ncbi:MAG: response regulator [Deltaproteobacteria bacterium]|nr:response regulator [Deltaproteobacteria bacterium]